MTGATDMQAAVDGLVQRNVARLAAHVHPGLLEAIAGLAAQRAFHLPDGLPAAPADRRALANAVVGRYAADPAVIAFSDLQPVRGTGRIADLVVADICAQAVEGRAIDPAVVPAGGPLVSFGAGDHLLPMLERYETRDLYVLDPNVGAFCAALAEQDWAPVCDLVEARDGCIRFIWNDDPVLTAIAAIEAVRADSFDAVDGTRLVLGYPNAALEACAAAFMERRDSLVAYNGYVEDEALLYRQAFGNLPKHDHLLLDRDSPVRPGIPAFVVGSGASLDACFDLLRDHRDRACIVSCGTALLPLLEHGVRPHIHCELESVAFIRDIIRFTASRHDLSDIVLMASNTVNPDVCDLFGRRILCFREGTAASRVLTDAVAPLPLIAPACTNTGVRAAHALGFRDICLFGIDLGSRTPDAHHAAGSIYHQIEAYNAFIGEDGRKLPPRGSATGRYNHAVEANFGGTVQTNAHMLHMRSSFELLARALPEARFRNCSDGVRISGVEPVRPGELGLPPHPAAASDAALDQALASLRSARAGTLIDRTRIEAFEAALAEWYGAARAALAEARAQAVGPDGLQALFRPLLLTAEAEADPKDIRQTCRYIHTGTLMKVFHYLRYAHSRIAEQDRPQLMAVALERLEEAIERIAARGMRLTVRKSLVHMDRAADSPGMVGAMLGYPFEERWRDRDLLVQSAERKAGSIIQD